MKLIVKVITKSSENKIIFDEVDLFGDRIIKIKTTAVPENGKANKSVIEIISKYLNIPKSNIAIIKGTTSSNANSGLAINSF